MKKFSNLNESNKIQHDPTTKSDVIKNIINESLSISNGQIVGKDKLIEIIDKLFKINECKTSIKVLENVKLLSRHSFSFEAINEAIESEKRNMNFIITKIVKVEEKLEIINESKKCEDEKCKDEECEDEKCKDEKCKDEEKPPKKVEPSKEDEQEIEENNIYIPDYNNGSMKDILEMSDIINKIINEEHHLVSKDERIKFILEHIEKRGVKTIILNYIKNHPIYAESSDVEKTLKDLNDKQVEEIYLKVEEIPSVIKTVDVPIKEHHLDSREDRINFILDALDNVKVRGIIIDYISKVPSYVKTSDIDSTIHELADSEIEELYLMIEEEIYTV